MASAVCLSSISSLPGFDISSDQALNEAIEIHYFPAHAQSAIKRHSYQLQMLDQELAHHYLNEQLYPALCQQSYDLVPQFLEHPKTGVELWKNQVFVPSNVTSAQDVLAMGPYTSFHSDDASTQQQLQYTSTPQLPSETLYSAHQSPDKQIHPGGAQARIPAEFDSEFEQRQYRRELRIVFGGIRNGRVIEASDKLLQISRQLLSSVASLGLHHDVPSQSTSRRALWKEFNHCWISLGGKQMAVTKQWLVSRQGPRDMLNADYITSMINELVTLCDGIEQYGMVDYDMGVWEERIIDTFLPCLDLFPSR